MSLVHRRLGGPEVPRQQEEEGGENGKAVKITLKKKSDGVYYHYLPFFNYMTLEQLKEEFEEKRIRQTMVCQVSREDKPKIKKEHTIVQVSVPHSKLFKNKMENEIYYDVLVVYERVNFPPLYTFLCIMCHWSYWQNMSQAKVIPSATFDGIFDIIGRGNTAVYFLYNDDADYCSTQKLFEDTIKEKVTSDKILEKDDVAQLEHLESLLGAPLFHNKMELLQNATQKNAKKIMLYLLKHEKCPKNYINEEDTFGRTALSRAQKPEIVGILLENGADVLKKNRSGETFLVELATGLLEVDVIHDLLSKLDDDVVEKLINHQNNQGETVLHSVANSIFEKPSIIIYLIGRGADPTIKNNEGKTPLEVEFKKDSPNKDGFIKTYKRTPMSPKVSRDLKSALRFGRVDEVQKLIDEGYDVWMWGSRGTVFADLLDDEKQYLTKKEQREAAHLLFAHPDCPHNFETWKGGWVKKDPLTQIRTLEAIQFFIDVGADLSRPTTFPKGNILTAFLDYKKDDLICEKISLVVCHLHKKGVNVVDFIKYDDNNVTSPLESAKENFPEAAELLEKFINPDFDWEKYESEKEKEKEKE